MFFLSAKFSHIYGYSSELPRQLVWQLLHYHKLHCADCLDTTTAAVDRNSAVPRVSTDGDVSPVFQQQVLLAAMFW